MGVPVTFTLKLKAVPKVLVDARWVSPDRFADRAIDEIKKFRVLEGGWETTVGELFEVIGPEKAPADPKEIDIVIEGSTSKICYIGYKMSGGRIVIRGDAGHFIGYKMRGGVIMIHGSVRNYLGCKMKDGIIEVFGNAGHRVGSKLQGEKPGKGMKKGSIVIHGNAGSEVGLGMTGGTIVVEKSAGNLVGSSMTGGTIVIKEGAGLYPGLEMLGGRIVIGGVVKGILPSFYVDSYIPLLKVRGMEFKKPFLSFIGDAVVGGRGFLQISYEDNKSLLEFYKSLVEEV
jgi:formylmethanofuran dehydrogenase subunit C